MSDKAVETAASILHQKVEKEHRKHSTSSKQPQTQKKIVTGSRLLQKTNNSNGKQYPIFQEECTCNDVKAEIEAGKKSSMMVIDQDGSDKRLRRRSAIAEKNETERILTKEIVKVLTKST